MNDFLRGQKESIRKLCGGLCLELELYHRAPVEIDISCFGLDAAGTLADERYFIFYNQKQSPEGAISCSAGEATGAVLFQLALDKLPSHIDKLSFTASIDGTRTMRELNKGHARLLANGQEVGRFSYDGASFTGERALVVCEIYRRGDEWRFNPVGRGFNGGLKALVESFGGIVANTANSRLANAPTSSPVNTAQTSGRTKASAPARQSGHTPIGNETMGQILSSLPDSVCTHMDDLARQCRGDTEYLASLYKNMFASLASYPQLATHSVKSVFCSDVSGSMFDMYKNGRIQRALDKLFAWSTTLSDGFAMDFWAFAAKTRQYGAVTMDNVRDYTFAESGGFERWMSMLNYQYNNEPEAMRDIMMIYGGRQEPVVVLFVTDGQLNSDWAIEEILIKTSRFPVFWQFIGLHGQEYGILDHLHEIDGRHINNAAFLKLDDIDDLTDRALFESLLQNLDCWIHELTEKHLLQ